jgi:hypothetical protein
MGIFGEAADGSFSIPPPGMTVAPDGAGRPSDSDGFTGDGDVHAANNTTSSVAAAAEDISR